MDIATLKSSARSFLEKEWTELQGAGVKPESPEGVEFLEVSGKSVYGFIRFIEEQEVIE